MIWTGLHNLPGARTRDFKWMASGEQPLFTFWAEGEPDAAEYGDGEGKDCVVIRFHEAEESDCRVKVDQAGQVMCEMKAQSGTLYKYDIRMSS